jgi:RHH-type proline utilization regulon transcriptional repressor/proline dehydrogenase/delta 1-pyrroline-5-carboxylate dehydrogenase
MPTGSAASHVVRYRADRLDGVLQTIERSGYGLTLGIHSRIDDTIEAVIDRLACQPQHGRRRGRCAAVRRPWAVGHRSQGRRTALSDAVCDRTNVTINTAAAGGNAALLSDGE